MAKRGESHPTEFTDLFGRRFVSIAETQDGQRLDEGLVKMLTGGERIRARRMREDFWEFEPTHTPFLATNYKPIVRGTDHGIWRRLLLVPFNATFIDPYEEPENPGAPLKDRELPAKLKLESYGILRWIVAGCQRWRAEGLNPPAKVRAATASYRCESDLVARFVEEHCQLDSGGCEKASRLYTRFRDWCQDGNEKAPSQKRFSEQLLERNLKRERLKTGWHYFGICLISSENS